MAATRRASGCSAAFFVAAALMIGAVPVLSAQGRSPSAQRNAVNAGDSIQAEVKGELSRVRAPGQEHTGFQISAGKLTWEVDVSGQRKLHEAAERLDGTRVLLRGTYTERRAPRLRSIIAAEELEPAPESGRAEYIDVTVRGTVTTGVMAIGAETTGATITADTVTWDLELNDEFRRIAERLSGSKATVAGPLRRAAGVEIGNRFIINVRRIE